MRLRLGMFLGLLLGLVIFVLSLLTLNGNSLQSFRDLDHQARQQDTGLAAATQQPCANPRLTIAPTDRVLFNAQTEEVTLSVSNTDIVHCDITVTLDAPKFHLQPNSAQQIVALAPTSSGTVSWKVTPTANGTSTLTFTAGNASQRIGVSVIDGNGFAFGQGTFLNYVGVVLGVVLALIALLGMLVLQGQGTRATVTDKKASTAVAAASDGIREA